MTGVQTCALPISLSILFAKSLSGHIYKMFRAQSEARAEQTAMVNEAIGNQKVIQAFHHEEATMEQFQENNKKLQETSLRASFFSSLINPGTRFIYAVVYAAVGLIGALSVLSGRITIGGLSCFLNYTNQYTDRKSTRLNSSHPSSSRMPSSA